MLGGMSWESTAMYYQSINEGVRDALGGLHSAQICLFSVDFAEIKKLQHQSRWDEAASILSHAAASVEAAGADFLIICTNTMHKIAGDIERAISIPLLHIADATAQQLVADGITRVGLIGTKFTMEQDFYKGRLTEKFNIDVIVPDASEQDIVHDIIYSELCLGLIIDESRQKYLSIIESLHAKGAEAVILGCTEIILLIQQKDSSVRLYDTTQIHTTKAVAFALSK